MEERYKMLPHGVGFKSSEAKPLRDGTDDYLCKYTIPADTVGTLVLRVGGATADMAGNSVTEASEHIAPFVVKIPEEVPIAPHEPEPDPTPVPPTTPTEPISSPVDEAQRQAEWIVDRIIYLLNDSGAINDRADRIEIIEEESGLAYESFIAGTLLDIYLEERPEEKGNPFSWYDIVLEYLRLGFVYPDADEEELLEHFRQSVQDGRVTIDINESAYIKKRRNQREKQKMVISEVWPIYERVFWREVEVLQQYHLENIPLNLPIELDTIFMEEAGISFDFAHNTLLAIHLEENPEDEDRVATGEYQHAKLIFYYLFLRGAFDFEDEEGILNRFRKASGEGNTPIRLGAPLAAL